VAGLSVHQVATRVMAVQETHLLGTADASMEAASSPPSVPTSVAATSAGPTPSRDINTSQLEEDGGFKGPGEGAHRQGRMRR
jgi:hypothetical protein